MAKKVILDVDPGIDDAVAMCLALFDPRLEVIAVTATAGNISASQATRNVQTVIEQLDPPRLPRVGVALPEVLAPVDVRHIHGSDGLGDGNFHCAELHHRHPADKVICDEVNSAMEPVTLIALGPLTNIAAAVQRNAELMSTLGQLIIVGGTYAGPGNVTPAAEFNMYCNPSAAKLVLRAPLTKTVVPLDITSQLVMTYNHFDQLPSDSTKVGAFLRKILSYAFRSHRKNWGMEGIYLHNAVGVVAALHPELFETRSYGADVETTGEITTGATVFDRRGLPNGQATMEVVVSMDSSAVMDCIMRGLAAAAD